MSMSYATMLKGDTRRSVHHMSNATASLTSIAEELEREQALAQLRGGSAAAAPAAAPPPPKEKKKKKKEKARPGALSFEDDLDGEAELKELDAALQKHVKVSDVPEHWKHNADLLKIEVDEAGADAIESEFNDVEETW